MSDHVVPWGLKKSGPIFIMGLYKKSDEYLEENRQFLPMV